MSLKTHNFAFGDFCLVTNERILLRDGKPVSLTPKTLQLLFILVENHGRIVEKADLINAIWADSFVEEGNLTFTVSLLRKTLGDDKQNRYIETISKRGYRFVADVSKIPVVDVQSLPTPPQNVSNKSFTHIPLFTFILPVMLFLGIAWLIFFSFRPEINTTDIPILTEPFSLEKISTDGKVFNAVISPDGKNIVYSNGATNENKSVWLRQIETGNNVEIIPPGEFTYHGFAFSPDGMFVYFHRRSLKTEDYSNIYRTSIFGGVPTKIIENSYGKVNFSPDGKQLTFFRCVSSYFDCSLWTADALDGKNEKKIITLQSPRRISDAIFSPDGKSVVYASGQSMNGSNEFGLTEINLETGLEQEYITEKFFDIIKLAWLPNKDNLLLTGSKKPTKNFHIWLISKSRNQATALTKDSENYFSISLDKKAETLVSTQVKSDFQLEIFSPDEANSTLRILANAMSVNFAPNGKLVYSSAMSGNDEIWSILPDGTERKQLTNNLADETSPVVSPDNNFIYFASNKSDQIHIWRMNFDGTNQIQLSQKVGGFPLFVSPDNKFVYYLHGLNRTLWRLAISENQVVETQVLNQAKDYFAISPNGEFVAFAEKTDTETNLKVVNLQSPDESVKTIKPPIAGCQITDIKWLSDNANLVYLLKNSQNQSKSLWQQSIDGKIVRKISDLGNQSIPHLAVSADGKTFAIVRGSWHHNAVLLKGLR